jgi:hypothetical protein
VTPDNLTVILTASALGLVQLFLGMLAKNTLHTLTNSIDDLRGADKTLGSRIEQQHQKLSQQITDVKVDMARQYVTREEISQGNRDLRTDINNLRAEILAEIRLTRALVNEKPKDDQK